MGFKNPEPEVDQPTTSGPSSRGRPSRIAKRAALEQISRDAKLAAELQHQEDQQDMRSSRVSRPSGYHTRNDGRAFDTNRSPSPPPIRSFQESIERDNKAKLDEQDYDDQDSEDEISSTKLGRKQSTSSSGVSVLTYLTFKVDKIC